LEQNKPVSPETVDLYRELSELYLEQGNVEAALRNFHESKKMGEKTVLPVWMYRQCITQARLNETYGDLDLAYKHLDYAEHLYIRTPLPDIQTISALKARIWIKQGKFDRATNWANGVRVSPEENVSFIKEYDHITLAKLLITQYKINKVEDSISTAKTCLERLLKAAENGQRIKSVIEILVLQALAYQAEGKISLALIPFERAISLAEPEGFIRIFVDEGKPVKDLLLDIETKLKERRLLQFIVKLRSAFDNPKLNFQENNTFIDKYKPRITTQSLPEPLSERELEVLKLLRTDLNGPEIARECTVSLTTIRTHTQNIYTKLGVNNRRAAIRRAEELNLF